jgi:DNA helicase II / ATP-dependent DNA helicase PcrA
MRLPKIRQLTTAQKEVYLYAPTDKHVLVNGPPGTGKTLIACLRAIELQKKNVPVILGMFNRVLAKYSSNVADGGTMPSQTVLIWFREWWKHSGLPPHPNISGRIAIQAAFDQNDQVRSAGAFFSPYEWKPWGRRPGAWVVDPDVYFAKPEAFASWRLWHSPPSVEGRSGSIDWNEVAKHILDHEACIPDASLDLGTLLIDEGQDFPPGFFKTLRQISSLAASRGKRVTHPPRCFVLADENQQIGEENSTLQEIVDALRIAEEHRYRLLDNFRNSKEIAELARAFFADVGVLPNVPERTSEKPAYFKVSRRSDIVEHIRIWVTNNPGKELGVLVFDDDTRAEMFSALQHSMARLRGRKVTIQTYSWKSRKENKAEDLKFDVPDVVTVLNVQSCKGLEFDAVFIVDLHQAQIGIYGPDRFKMQMFVAVSRGRDWVSLLDSGTRAGVGPYMECLPGKEFLDHEDQLFGCKSKSPSLSLNAKKDPQRNIEPEMAKNSSNLDNVDDWEAELAKLKAKLGLMTRDMRPAGGALWVNGDRQLRAALEPLGFSYSEKREGWWRK